MKALLERVVDAASGRCEYADVRAVLTRRERLATRNGALDELDSRAEEGVGVRVRVGGAWGFAAARGVDAASAEEALRRALAVAAAQPAVAGAGLAPEPPARGSWETPVDEHPFEVPLEDKLAVLGAADAGLRTTPGVKLTTAHFLAIETERWFASTEGALCSQRTVECGGGISALAADGSQSQIRSYPASHGGHVAQAGWEHLLALDLPGHAPRVAEEAVALLSAPACPEGRTTVILAGEQLALQVHESIGHAVELDRVLGREASYAGTSFLAVDGLDSFRVGSELVNVTADATEPAALGTFAWDDEGVEAQRVPIVREGVLRGFLSSRETATEIGVERSGGCMRADGFARQPIVRMTNVNLEPGDAGSLDDLIADTGEGILIETNRSWSIDNRRLRFQFEGEAAWEIAGGRRGRLLRNPSYAGTTPELWASCDAICSPDERVAISLLDCGKGEPGQVMRVSHGCAPARFRDVRVGMV